MVAFCQLFYEGENRIANSKRIQIYSNKKPSCR